MTARLPRHGAVVLALSAIFSGLAAPRLEARALRASAARYLRFFARGQCTRWAYLRRPDIVNRGFGVVHLTNWNAYLWAANASRAGFPVNGAPRAGDIAVWPPGVEGAGSVGHVAYVRRVMRHGALRISEVGWNGRRTPHDRTISRRDASRLQFVHHR